MQLVGTEVKSLRGERCNHSRTRTPRSLGESCGSSASHAPVRQRAERRGHDPERDRKLLLHRREIDRLAGRARERGLTLVPTRLDFKDGRAKVEIALARGKELRDKRRDIAKRDADRQIERALRARNR